MVDVVSRTAEQIFIPLTVGGGVRTLEDVDSLLRCGADKVGVNTAAINDPTLYQCRRTIRQSGACAVRRCPSRTRENDIRSQVSKSPPWAGANPLALTPFGGVKRAQELGAGEILPIQWMPMAQTRLDLEMMKAVRKEVKIRIIAGGARQGPRIFRRQSRRAPMPCSLPRFSITAKVCIGEVKDAIKAAGYTVR